MEYLSIYKRLFSISQACLQYGQDDFDKQRYQELRELSLQLLEKLGNEPIEVIEELFKNEVGYQTPKVDVRAWIKEKDKILLVEDAKTKEWSLPGGYADIGFSPLENVEKEVWEETGLTVRTNKLKAVFDTNLRKDIPQAFQYYKLVFDCEILEGAFIDNLETSQAAFFSLSNLPKLSEKRTTEKQLHILCKDTKSCYFE